MSQSHKDFKILVCCLSVVTFALLVIADEQPIRPWLKNRRTLATRAQPQPSQAPQTPAAANKPFPVAAAATSGTGTVSEVPIQKLVSVSAPVTIAGPQSNRSTRTADIFEKDYNIIVTNTCERESMKVNIEVSKPFYGVIHTRNQRQKQICSVEGNGDQKYSLEISHILNSNDPAYCGVIRARRDSVEDKDVLSVVIAVRVHRNIELSDDKFFLLNCTNRCRKADCSQPSAKLTDLNLEPNSGEDASSNPAGGEREADASARDRNPGLNEECTIWKFPWAITLFWCLGILLLAMIISHCIMCSSMVCRCVKREVEETEPSIYEGGSDYEDDHRYSQGNNKKSPYTIDYDNKDIYKTSNNYAPYTLEEAQTSRKHRKASR